MKLYRLTIDEKGTEDRRDFAKFSDALAEFRKAESRKVFWAELVALDTKRPDYRNTMMVYVETIP